MGWGQELKTRVQECGTTVSQWQAEAREVLLRYLVHTADITNPIRPSYLSQEWSRRIMQEFYAQVPTTPPCVTRGRRRCCSLRHAGRAGQLPAAIAARQPPRS